LVQLAHAIVQAFRPALPALGKAQLPGNSVNGANIGGFLKVANGGRPGQPFSFTSNLQAGAPPKLPLLGWVFCSSTNLFFLFILQRCESAGRHSC